MVKGMDNTKTKKKPWKTKIERERDVMLLRGAYLQQDASCDIVKKLDNKPKKKK